MNNLTTFEIHYRKQMFRNISITVIFVAKNYLYHLWKLKSTPFVKTQIYTFN